MTLRLTVIALSLLASTTGGAQDTSTAVARLQAAAEVYQPTLTGQLVVPRLPSDSSWAHMIDAAFLEDSLRCLDPLVLIILKLHLEHLRCCGQTYDIKGDAPFPRNPITRAFLRLSKVAPWSEPIEWVGSDVAYDFVLRHRKRFHSAAIEDLVHSIRQEKNRIGKYWSKENRRSEK